MPPSRYSLHAPLLLILPALLLGRTALGQKAHEEPQRWTPAEMMEVKQIGDVHVSPDGQRVVYTVTEPVMTEEKSEYLTHLYMADTDGTNAYPFTFGDASASNPQWSSDGGLIAFTSRRSGKNNLWLIRTHGGGAWQLTDVETGVAGFEWSPDGRRIAFTAATPPSAVVKKAKQGKDDAYVVGEDPSMSHLWVVPVAPDLDEKPEARRLTEGTFNVGGGFDWSPDGTTIAFHHTPTSRASDWKLADISTIEVETGAVKPLAQTGAAELSPRYSPDGRYVAFIASDDPPTWGITRDIYVVEARGGTPRRLAPTHDRFFVDLAGWSADGQRLLFTETRGTTTRLAALPLDGSPPQDLDLEEGVLESVALSASGRWLGFVAEAPAAPPEAYVARLDRLDPVQVSRANAGLPDHALGRTEVVRWRAPDSLEIEGLLTYPVGYQEGRRYPLLLVIHGGPWDVYRQSFIANPHVRYQPFYPIAAFASDGFAVLRSNFRGSNGYGRDFRYANFGDWGGADYQDLMAGVDYVIERGVADPDRLGVMGWSYGGYMASWIITQTDRFETASIGAPVTNLVSFTGTTDIPGFIPDYFGGEFWEKLEPYLERSPMFNIQGVTTPVLIQHGEEDERVPIGQGYELYNALKRQGVDVKMVVYPRTPHFPREPKLHLDVMRRNLVWFHEHLMDGSMAGTR